MSDKYSFAFNETQQSGGHPHDLLARLYREIGISAVAAALEVTNAPATPAAEPVSFDERRLPAALRSDDLAA